MSSRSRIALPEKPLDVALGAVWPPCGLDVFFLVSRGGPLVVSRWSPDRFAVVAVVGVVLLVLVVAVCGRSHRGGRGALSLSGDLHWHNEGLGLGCEASNYEGSEG